MFKHSDKIILSADIGGSHITTGLVRLDTLDVISGSIKETKLDGKAETYAILMQGFVPAFQAAIDRAHDSMELAGIAIAMPGPFDYERGIFRLRGLDKFGTLYGVDFKQFLYDHLTIDQALPIFFKNDADCFGLGAYEAHIGHGGQDGQEGKPSDKLIGITLGTGLGSAFVGMGSIIESGTETPIGGHLYNQPLQFSMDTAAFGNAGVQEGFFSYDIAEELISSRGLLQYVNCRVYNPLEGATQKELVREVKTMADLARGALNKALGSDFSQNGLGELALEAFKVMGYGLGTCLRPWLEKFKAKTIVLGGGIAGAADLFMPTMRLTLLTESATATDAPAVDIVILTADQMQETPLVGAAYALKQTITERETDKKLIAEKTSEDQIIEDLSDPTWRKTHQSLLPKKVDNKQSTSQAGVGEGLDKKYELFPYHSLGEGKIQGGFESLARQLSALTSPSVGKLVALDGYSAVDWESLHLGLSGAFKKQGLSVIWMDMASFARPAEQIETLVAPYIGEPGDVWGTKTEIQLMDLFDQGLIKTSLTKKQLNALGSDLVIIYGTGAALCGPDIPVAFVELPKNEIQYRMRAGKADNLLTSERPVYADMYKRAYFVDWPMLDHYREQIMASIQVVIDGQWRTDVHWCLKEDLMAAFKRITHAPIRVRPWFAPGAWGGDWMKNHFNQLNQQEVNYAWSFELIAPENGLVFESDGLLFEVSFDMLMASQAPAILGADAEIFGHYFPIRFDFLDTFNGGNLSIQCHPSLPYIKTHFGEMITQDETYYILDAAPDAGVYLGFQEGVDPESFRAALEKSQQENQAMDIEQYVQLLPAKKHDLFLIPNQTLHSAAAGNLVLEISATPYIFTFKMYDWVRPDLNGKPRPINIEHAFNNLDFSRSGNAVQQELLSQPVLVQSNDDYAVIDLPTHLEHFYAIRRIEIKTSIDVQTAGKCQIMMVVEGAGVVLELPSGQKYYYAYAETFIVPAAIESYTLIHPAKELKAEAPDTEFAIVKVIQSFIKD